MFGEWLSTVPAWLWAGLGAGGVATVAAAGAFYLGDRFYPTERRERAGRGRVDGPGRRRREIRQYLRRIDERYREDYDVDGCEVAFYLPEREVAITFDPQAYFRLEDAGVFTVLCEHEMPGDQLGRRLPFETPDLAAVAPVDDPVSEAFATLGVPADADETEVKRAYRERVKGVHPDQGGDEEEFKRVREAYSVARNHAEADA